MKCANQFNCSGRYVLQIHEEHCDLWKGEKGAKCTCAYAERTWVKAMELPVFAQCNQCGVAPHDIQGKLVNGLTKEIIATLDGT